MGEPSKHDLNMPDKDILVATVGAPHGIKGEVRLKSFTDDPMAIRQYGPLHDNSGNRFILSHARPSKSMLIVRFDGVTSREAAEALRGLDLYVDRSVLPQIEEEDEYYLSDLIGMTVKDIEGNIVGHVRAIPNFGADDLLEIQPAKGSGGQSYYLPFTKKCVPTINLEEEWLQIDPPDEIVVQETSK